MSPRTREATWGDAPPGAGGGLGLVAYSLEDAIARLSVS
jgi:hypothetical protein